MLILLLKVDYEPKEYVAENKNRARHEENKNARGDLVKDCLTLLFLLMLEFNDLFFGEILVLVLLCHYYYSLRAIILF